MNSDQNKFTDTDEEDEVNSFALEFIQDATLLIQECTSSSTPKIPRTMVERDCYCDCGGLL